MREQVGTWNDCLEFAALSDVGMRRTNNQDSFAAVPASSDAVWVDRGHLFLVADGMGAHAAGELASEIAAETVPHTYHKLRNESPPLALRAAIKDANRKIHSRGQSDVGFHGMGTTSSAMVILPQGVVVGHVGDSRVYRLRSGRLEQLTFDHSLVWEMMATGKLKEDEVPGYIPKNVITRSLGPNEDVQIDLEGPFQLAIGDTFLLCSDGLTGQVKDEEIGALLDALPPREAAQVLVDLANLRGGPDNITIVVVKITGPISTDLPFEPLPPLPEQKRPTKGSRKAHIAAWAALGISLGAIVPLLMIRMLPGVGVAILGAIAAGLFLRFKLGVGAPDDGNAQVRYGRGPHVAVESPANAEFVESLSATVDKVRDAIGDDWPIDWRPFEDLKRQAADAAAHERYVDAVRDYGRAISHMMDGIRQVRTKKA